MLLPDARVKVKRNVAVLIASRRTACFATEDSADTSAGCSSAANLSTRVQSGFAAPREVPRNVFEIGTKVEDEGQSISTTVGRFVLM